MTQRVLLMPGRQAPDRVALPAAMFDFPVAAIGITGHASVYYDTSLGTAGHLLASQVFHLLPQAIVKCELDFGQAVLDFNVVVAGLDGSHQGLGGAYHYGCDFTTGRTLYVDAAFGDPLRTLGLVIAELTECQMGLQNAGWNCGGSNGEALSRFLAELMSGGPRGQLAAYATGPAWDQVRRPNWIDMTEPTDTNPVSTGCGMVYLYWMWSIGYTVPQIVQAGGATLAQNYRVLTRKSASSAWSDFSAACSKFSLITSDDPWV
jgi:hypothetical protein